jgi:hypothetical protein
VIITGTAITGLAMFGKATFGPDGLLDVLSGLVGASLRTPSLIISDLKSSGNGHTSISNHSTYFLNLIILYFNTLL